METIKYLQFKVCSKTDKNSQNCLPVFFYKIPIKEHMKQTQQIVSKFKDGVQKLQLLGNSFVNNNYKSSLTDQSQNS